MVVVIEYLKAKAELPDWVNGDVDADVKNFNWPWNDEGHQSGKEKHGFIEEGMEVETGFVEEVT